MWGLGHRPEAGTPSALSDHPHRHSPGRGGGIKPRVKRSEPWVHDRHPAPALEEGGGILDSGLRHLKQLRLRRHRRLQAEMPVRERRGHAALRGAFHETHLDEVGLVHFLERLTLFPHGHRH